MVKMKEVDGEKSIGLRMIDDKKPYKKLYNIINVPATKLRTFMEADLKYLVEQLAQPEVRGECTWPQGLSPSEYPGSLQAFLKKYPQLNYRLVTEEDMKEFNSGN